MPFVLLDRDGKRATSGIAIHLVRILGRKFGFRAEFQLEETIVEEMPNGTIVGVIERIANRKVDLALDIPVNLWFIQAGDYSSYSYMVDYYLAARQPDLLPPVWNILYPLDGGTWAALGAAVAALAAAFAALAAAAGDDGVVRAALIPYGILFQEYLWKVREGDRRGCGCGDVMLPKKAKALRMVWVLASFVITMSYSGNLKASIVYVHRECAVTSCRRSK